MSAEEFAIGDELTVEVTIGNTGDRSGTEVVQLYVRDLIGSVTRPVKELKGFRLVELKPGATRTVRFTLTEDDLAFFTARGHWEAEPGEFTVSIGRSSADALLEEHFLLKARGEPETSAGKP